MDASIAPSRLSSRRTVLGERIEQCNQSQSIQLDTRDMLYEHVMKPSYAPSASLANSFGTTFMEYLSIIIKYSDDQSISLSNADVNFDAEMQKCDELSVQPFPCKTIKCSQSMEIRAAQLCQHAACLIA